MFKKFISYLIVFSILHTDLAQCGIMWGRELPSNAEDEEWPRPIPIRRYSTQDTGSAIAIMGQPERTPLAFSKRWTTDSAGVTHLATNFNFEDFATRQG